MFRWPTFSLVLAVVLSLTVPGLAAVNAASHPFMLWTSQEAAALKKRIETEPWAKARYDAMLKEGGRGKTFRNLFRYVVMGDLKAGEEEKKYLLGIIGTHPKDGEKLEHGGRHYDCYLDALRYDGVYNLLSPEERAKIEATFRDYIAYQLTDTKNYTRTSWLPNMQWPRPMAAHIMAVALKDEGLIRKLIQSNGGWKWYLDEYITSEGFYMEEFGKHYSMIGEMLLFCRGLRNIGLDNLGYGYTGKGGATMRKYLESIFLAGYPRIDIPGGMPHYPKITMGDARTNHQPGSPPYVFQHAVVAGYMPDGQGGSELWGGANMNGRDHRGAKVDKLMGAQWFEIGHSVWPDAGFDYFLAQSRKPGEAVYTPSLLWGCSPIDPAKAKAPPAVSYASVQRSLALLRADESSAYWESPAPAVAMNLGAYYVHYTRDPLALYGLVAFNRPLYQNRGIADGYAGTDPWTDSMRGHAGLVVDNLPGNPIGQLPARFSADALAKFVAVTDDPRVSGGKILSCDNTPIPHDKTIVPNATQTRALLLTRQYLLDVIRAQSNTHRTYQWQVHALGLPRLDGPWTNTTELDGGKLYINADNRSLLEQRAKDPNYAPAKGPEIILAKALSDGDRYDLQNVKKLATDGRWSAIAQQDCALPDVKQSLLGQAWYDRKIGVRIRHLPEPGTTIYVGDTARYVVKAGREPNKSEKSTASNEVGGVTILVQRHTPATTFVALHEPFENGNPAIHTFERIAQSDSAVLVAIASQSDSAVNDRAMIRFDHQPAEPVTLAGNDESFTFADHALVRIAPDAVTVSGDLRAMKLRVTGSPRLIVNGKNTPAKIEGGMLLFQ